MYIGRFAPSPTGPLHAGSLVAALASWLDARAHGGRWLVRIEDVDTPRCVPEATEFILSQMAACGLHPDAPPVRQSLRSELYQQALDQLEAQGLAYPCSCSRKDIEAVHTSNGLVRVRGGEWPYPGTCRPERIRSAPPHHRPARAWRLHTGHVPAERSTGGVIRWHDRRLGAQLQHVESVVGDFVLKRADGLWAYQLAVVVDDAAQGVTHVVRGQDLADNTPRQILLQHALGLPTPLYLHTPLVKADDGEKLSKQNGAKALDLTDPLDTLSQAAAHLKLTPASGADTLSTALAKWVKEWGEQENSPQNPSALLNVPVHKGSPSI